MISRSALDESHTFTVAAVRNYGSCVKYTATHLHDGLNATIHEEIREECAVQAFILCFR